MSFNVKVEYWGTIIDLDSDYGIYTTMFFRILPIQLVEIVSSGGR